MKINYGINRRGTQKEKLKIVHKNGKLDLTQYTNNDWDNDDVHREIKRIITGKHPGWAISGYGLVPEPPSDTPKP